MVDDDWLRRHEEGVQPLGDLGELHPLGLENLKTNKKKKITSVR